LGRDDGDIAIVSRALSLAKSDKALLTLFHVADSAPAQVYSKDVYDEHTRDDEQYLLEISAEVRASGVCVDKHVNMTTFRRGGALILGPM
jgi:manganese transport protein